MAGRRVALGCLLAGTLLAGGAPPARAGQYAVIGRYACVDTTTGDAKGACEIRTDSKISCAAALQSQKQDLAARGDVCRICEPYDATRRWDGNPAQFIQDGACQGVH